jgi:hypothetical protein
MQIKNILRGMLALPLWLYAAAPQAPSDLVLTATSATTVSISWKDNSSDESGFKIFRDNQLIHTTTSDIEHYVDSGLTPLTTYTYTIKSTNSDELIHTTLQKAIIDGNDDIEERADGSMYVNSSDLELTNESGQQTIGLRFQALSIPKDAIITKAYIQFTTDEVSSETTNLNIYAEDTGNALEFPQTVHGISSKILTSTHTTWTPPSWNNVGEKSEAQATPDLSPIVQEIINKDDWQSGNAIAFIITGTGKRVAESYDGGDTAPIFYIEYDSQYAPPPPVNGTGIVINEILTANATTNYDPDFKQFSDWIELYNHESHSIDIGGFYLSDDTANPTKYKIPSGTTIASHDYLLIWADEENTKSNAIHTNFKLSQKGETLTLADKSGNVIDILEFPEQDGDISCAKVNDTIVYMEPTPKSANSQTYDELKRSKKPKFSLDSGFYSGTQSIELTQKNDGLIYYTLDGSIPTKSSTLYSQPISINKTTVIRTRAYETGKLLSNVKNQTFLINENISLPVVSIAIDDKYLYDSSIGIYTNYTEKWMRAGSVELIKDGESQFSENVGIRVFGNNTRVYPQKSLSIFMKDKYGPKSLKYSLFKDKPEIKKVKSFTMRNGGTEWGRELIGDAVQHHIIKNQMDIDYQAYEPTIVFLNGKYWGIYNIREKINEDYLEANHGVDTKNIDLLEDHAQVKEGSNSDFLTLETYANSHDLSNDTYYNIVASQIDINEFINYCIVESFGGNSSIGHNIKYWKKQTDDGKWRWILFDLDRGFRYSTNEVFGYIEGSNSVKNIFNNLIKNDHFKIALTSKYYTQLNTTFQSDRMNSIIDEMKTTIEPEVSRHFQKWPKNQFNQDVSISTWNNFINKMYQFSDERESIVKQELKSKFNLSGNNNLNIPYSSNGTITIDGVKLQDEYNGEYFNGAKVTLKATPAEGHTFTQWSNGNTNQKITVTINNDTSISAEFN